MGLQTLFGAAIEIIQRQDTKPFKFILFILDTCYARMINTTTWDGERFCRRQDDRYNIVLHLPEIGMRNLKVILCLPYIYIYSLVKLGN